MTFLTILTILTVIGMLCFEKDDFGNIDHSGNIIG